MTVRILNWKEETEIKILEGHLDFVLSVAYSQDGKYVVSGSEDRTIRVWDIAEGVSV